MVDVACLDVYGAKRGNPDPATLPRTVSFSSCQVTRLIKTPKRLSSTFISLLCDGSVIADVPGGERVSWEEGHTLSTTEVPAQAV